MSSKYIACSVLLQVGIVNGHGYDGQQEDAICDVHDDKWFKSTFKPVFQLILTDWIALQVAQMPDLKIWQVS